jgi:hypothetical protein
MGLHGLLQGYLYLLLLHNRFSYHRSDNVYINQRLSQIRKVTESCKKVNPIQLVKSYKREFVREFKSVENRMKEDFFFILVCEAIGIAATPGLLCQPRVIVHMIVEK